MKKIYIAGKLSAYGMEYLNNCSKMISWAKKVRDLGFAVFVPFLDLLEVLQAGDMNYENVFNNSAEWLKVSDAVFLVPGWETSKGTLREIEIAEENNIPVFENIDKLREWKDAIY